MATTQVRSKQQFLVTDNLSFQSSYRINNLLDPVSAQDAATKAYVDATKQGLDVKDSVRAATTANITLSGTQTIDGVALVAGERVLVKNQSTASENGIYVVSASAWSRSSDANSSSNVTAGMFCFVEEGTTNADSGWVLTTNGTITVGTTALSFAQFSGAGQITAGNGLTKTGNTIDAVGTTNRIDVLADSIDISANYVGQSSIVTLGTVTTGTWSATAIAATRGGTGLTTYTLGDILYASAANTLSALAGSTVASKRFLTQTGNGTVSAAPSWGTIAASDIQSGAALTKTDDTNVTLTLGGSPSTALLAAASITVGWSGTLSVSRGGTGVSSVTAYMPIVGGTSSTSALQSVAAGTTAGQALLYQGASVLPSFGAINLAGGVNIVSGTLPVANGGTGQTSYVNGELLIGNTTGNTLTKATLTAGANITITNGAGSITIASTSFTTSNFVTREVPTGTINGVNTAFTLANTPTAGTEEVFVNGVLQNSGAGNDYTISTNTITFLSGAIPQTGDVVLVNYRK